jgi:hypothetical protein
MILQVAQNSKFQKILKMMRNVRFNINKKQLELLDTFGVAKPVRKFFFISDNKTR